MATNNFLELIKKKKPEDIFKVEPKPTPKPQQTLPSGKTEVIRDERGKLSGITTPSGRTLLGLSPSEVRGLAAKYAETAATPPGAVEAAQEAQLRQSQLQGQQLAAGVGQVSPEIVAQAQPAGVDVSQALGTAATGILPGLAAGAAAGAVGGSLAGGVGAIPGAIIGGGIGAISGFLSGIRSNIKAQRSDLVTIKKRSLTEREQNLNDLILDTNQNPAHASENMQLFNMQLSLIEKDHSTLTQETDEKLDKWLGVDGTPELARYEYFNEIGGAREQLVEEMRTALINPNPNAISKFDYSRLTED